MSTLHAALAELADEWERNYANMLVGGFSGCSIGADTAAKRIRNLLAAHPAPEPSAQCLFDDQCILPTGHEGLHRSIAAAPVSEVRLTEDEREHRLIGEIGRQACTCGWEAPLGAIVWRAFDKHLLDPDASEMTAPEAGEVRASHSNFRAICDCGHRVTWHHDDRGCGYHGFSEQNRCACQLTSDAAVESILDARLAEVAQPAGEARVEGDATWALRTPSLWESPDARSIPTLLAAIGQTLSRAITSFPDVVGEWEEVES